MCFELIIKPLKVIKSLLCVLVHGGKMTHKEDPDYYWEIESQVLSGEKGVIGEEGSAEVLVRPKAFKNKRDVLGHLINLWFYQTKNALGCNFDRG